MEKESDNDNFTYVAVENFSRMEKSKLYLYFKFVNQRKYFSNYLIVNWVLPPFKEWTIQYLKGILSNENKVILSLWFLYLGN